MAVYRSDVMCEVSKITYDCDNRGGQLHMAPNCAADMSGCIKLFTAIDPDVQIIETFAGGKSDAIYKRTGKEWGAALTR